MTKRRILIYCAFLASLAGCGPQLQDFVNQAKRPQVPVTLPSIKQDPGPRAPRISSGYVTAVGRTVGAEMTLSPTNTELRGTTLGVSVGISRTPAQSDVK